MYLAIEGVIGVGKTTLARMLQPAFQTNLLLEVFEENPFLSKFYQDRSRYAFQTQMFFLLSRYHQQFQGIPKAMAETGHLIADYTFEKDALFACINLQGDELEMYHRVHMALGEKIPRPDLTIYLRASTELLMQRIALRDRPYERDMDRGYIEEVNRAYDAFFLEAAHARSSPVLVIESEPLDYVRYPEDLRWIENRIRQALQLSPFQPELPLPDHGESTIG
jgi:deoxyguanosine kinase